jgi:hypothetical protein
MFKDGPAYFYDEKESGWPPVLSDELVQSADQKICGRPELHNFIT